MNVYVLLACADMPPWAWEAWTEYASGGTYVALEALDLDSLSFTERTAEDKGQAPWLADHNAQGPLWRPLAVTDSPDEMVTIAHLMLALLSAD